MTRFACGVGLSAMLALAGVAAGQEKDSPVDKAKLIGRWEKSEPKKDEVSQVEFKADGKVVFKLGVGGKVETYEGTYAVTGAKLKFAVKIGDRAVTEEVVVLRLTAEELHTEDSKGKKETLKRAP